MPRTFPRTIAQFEGHSQELMDMVGWLVGEEVLLSPNNHEELAFSLYYQYHLLNTLLLLVDVVAMTLQEWEGV